MSKRKAIGKELPRVKNILTRFMFGHYFVHCSLSSSGLFHFQNHSLAFAFFIFPFSF